MIISASRRTDIPAFYSEWFMNQIRKGSVLCKNPMNCKQVSRVDLSPDVVDCIVFWTKNPYNIIKYLSELDSYTYYFQVTITSYDKSIEKNVPFKRDIISTVKDLSDKIGNEKVIWRYDPIFYTKQFDYDYHIENYKKIAYALKGYTRKCVISFLDVYKKCERNMKNINFIVLSQEDALKISENFSAIAKECDFEIASCAEKYDLSRFNINHSKCIDDGLISRISQRPIKASKDKTQRDECGCIESIDIGTYDTCPHGCMYCYANIKKEQAQATFNRHNPKDDFIDGNMVGNEKVTDRKVKSLFSSFHNKVEVDLL